MNSVSSPHYQVRWEFVLKDQNIILAVVIHLFSFLVSFNYSSLPRLIIKNPDDAVILTSLSRLIWCQMLHFQQGFKSWLVFAFLCLYLLASNCFLVYFTKPFPTSLWAHSLQGSRSPLKYFLLFHCRWITSSFQLALFWTHSNLFVSCCPVPVWTEQNSLKFSTTATVILFVLWHVIFAVFSDWPVKEPLADPLLQQ